MAVEKSFKASFERHAAGLRKFELPGDALLLIYFAVLARQYLWWFTDKNGVAWGFSMLVAAGVGWLYISGKEISVGERPERPFWIVAALPLVFVYVIRVAFPDLSFDVLNYRLVHSERALRGFLYLPGDFFPTPAPYNPAPDMVTGIFRHLLGYRLGTIANLLAMIWVACIADKLLRPHLRNAWLRAFGVLLAVLAEHLIFEINNYMADLLGLPLLLEATYLALHHANWKNQRRNLTSIALLLGMAIAFKLTNASVAIPIVLLCTYRALRQTRAAKTRFARLKQLALTALICAAAFSFPLVPFSAYLYRDLGSVVFPVLNSVFKSPYWPASSVWDPRWGPVFLWEKFAWPVLILFKPDRLSELSVYSGRISLAFIAAIAGFVVVRRDSRLRELCFLFAASALLWSASTGYIRYALYVEVLATIFVLALASRLTQPTGPASPLGRGRLVAARLLFGVLAFQSCLALYYISQTEWSGRPTCFMHPGAFAAETKFLLRDRSLRKYLQPELRAQFDDVDVWIVSSIKTASLELLLQPNATLIGVNTGEYFQTAEGRARFSQALERVAGKRMYSLAFSEDLEAAKAALRKRRLTATEVVPIALPFYSSRTLLEIFLIKVEPPPPEDIYSAAISAGQQPSVMHVAEKQALHFRVKNAGSFVWPSRAPVGWMKTVTIGDRWLSANGSAVVNDLDSRTTLPRDLRPGDEAELVLIVTAPPIEGEYLLEIDMVHEGVTWFHQKGSPTLRWPVKVVRVAELKK